MWGLIVGGIAGWIAGQIMSGGGYGIIRNIILGILGSWVGVKVFGMLDIASQSTTIGTLVTSTVGAIVVILVYRLIFGK